MEMKDKICIITGSAQGLGKEFTKILLHHGAKVCISDIKEDVANKTLKELQHSYGNENVCFVKCDVTKEDEFANLFNETEKKFNVACVDVLVNNAGINTKLGWKKCIDVNMIGVMTGCGIALARMKKASKPGTVINISSMAGIVSPPCGGELVVGYTVSKAGIVALTKDLAKDFRFHGVCFKTLCPAWTDTELVSSTKEGIPEDRVLELERSIKSAGGLMTPEYVAKGFYKLVTECGNGNIMCVIKDTPFLILPDDAVFKVLISVLIAKFIGTLTGNHVITVQHQKLCCALIVTILCFIILKLFV